MSTKAELKYRNRHPWLWGGGLAFLLILLLPPLAYSQKASIREVGVKEGDGRWEVSFYVENCFTAKMEEAIQTGVKTVFTFYLQMNQKRKWWKDRRLASVKFHHAIQYDPIRGEYHVAWEENGSSFVASTLEEAKERMAKVEEVGVRPTVPLRPGGPLYLRIKAELDPVVLPLHLESLFFLVSLWDFETPWHVEPLQR